MEPQVDVAQVIDVTAVLQARLLEYAPRLVLAVGLLVAGWIGVNIVVRGLHRLFHRTEFDQALERFIESLANAGLKVILVVTVAGIAGVETTSLIALLGAAGLAVGLALQGSLANFAGGVIILGFKPFKFGDYIIAQGAEGKVHKIEIFSTTLYTLDNQRVVIPNGALANGVIVNRTGGDTRRIELQIGIGYECSVAEARQIALSTIATDPRVLHEPLPQVVLVALGDSSQNIEVRCWVNTQDYAARFDLLERVKVAFDEADINIPFPQRVVHAAPIAKARKASGK